MRFNSMQRKATQRECGTQTKENKNQAMHSKTKPISPQPSISTSDTNKTKCTHATTTKQRRAKHNNAKNETAKHSDTKQSKT